MSAHVEIELSQSAWSRLTNAAAAAGQTPGELAAAVIESVYGKCQTAPASPVPPPVEHWFGSIDMGRPIGIDNREIDRDLGKAYGAVESG